jgi:predicted phage replisome organizer
MAEVKWIKIVTNIFDDEKIRYIESMPNGNETIVIWFRILCLAGKSNNGGLLMMTDRIAYTEDMLASIFQRDVKSIQLALNIFESLEMIERMDNKIYLTNWEKHQNIDGLEKIRIQTKNRVQKHREIKKIADTVMNRDNFVCQYCGGSATGHDHVIPTSKGGSDTNDNKVACCIDCNKIKNDKPLVDFLNNNRFRINDNLISNNTVLRKIVTLSNVTDCYIVTQSNAIELDIDKERDKEIKNIKKYGVFENVSLSDEEYSKLEKENLLPIIDDLSLYLNSTGKKYKSHYATILTWDRNNKKKKQEVKSTAKPLPDYYDTKDEEVDKVELLKQLKGM